MYGISGKILKNTQVQYSNSTAAYIYNFIRGYLPLVIIFLEYLGHFVKSLENFGMFGLIGFIFPSYSHRRSFSKRIGCYPTDDLLCEARSRVSTTLPRYQVGRASSPTLEGVPAIGNFENDGL